MKYLRNKQYAHKELDHDRHHASYFIDEQGGIKIDAGGAQTTIHYHPTLCVELINCLQAVASYLAQDIGTRNDHIVGKLTDEQRHALRVHAAKGE